MVTRVASLLLPATLLLSGCDSSPTDDNDGEEPFTPVFYTPSQFVMGVDLSYANQVRDFGGKFRDEDGERSPFSILRDHGANVVRLRLWHNPAWVRTEVYQSGTVPLYSGLDDVIASSGDARQEGFQVNIGFHYSDTWADPGHQQPPAAWQDITELSVLEDSIYNYTKGVLESLDAIGLLPEMVHLGNEINCGMLSVGAGESFPDVDVCDGHWQEQGTAIRAGIRAVRDAAPSTRIILHVAQPENVEWWFDNITTAGGVTDFDVVGFSYYAQWSTTPLVSIANLVSRWRQRYGKDVMILETAYPWTLQNADSYGNILGQPSLGAGYPATQRGQREYMINLVQAVMDGGGSGVFYWEPAWITSGLQDLWGQGSSWDNSTLFDFDGDLHEGSGFMTFPYELQP